MTPREALDRMMAAAETGDVNAFADLMADDGVLEFPFTPSGDRRRVQGREEIRAFLAAAYAGAPRFRAYGPVTVHQTTDPDIAIAEYEWHGDAHGTGRPFTQIVVLVVQVRDGRIVAARDYLNPVVLAGAADNVPV